MRKIAGRIALQICCLLMVISGGAQVKNSVVRFHAYIQETVAGNVEVDSAGVQSSGVDYVHHLYAETTGKYPPQWNVLYTNKGVFAIQAEEIRAARYQVGKLKNGSKPVWISAKRGNRLWKLELVPLKARIPANIEAILRKNDAVVMTEWKGKQFTHTIAKEIPLETIYYK